MKVFFVLIYLNHLKIKFLIKYLMKRLFLLMLNINLLLFNNTNTSYKTKKLLLFS